MKKIKVWSYESNDGVLVERTVPIEHSTAKTAMYYRLLGIREIEVEEPKKTVTKEDVAIIDRVDGQNGVKRAIQWVPKSAYNTRILFDIDEPEGSGK